MKPGIEIPEGYIVHDITCEGWREYNFVVVENVVHCMPAPGHCGCVLRWKNHENKKKPVEF